MIKSFLINKLKTIEEKSEVKKTLNNIAVLQAQILAENHNKMGKIDNIQQAEFKVFSQFGDDGIIQYLVTNINIKYNEKRFVEFGVENYLESNTRYLLINNQWEGLLFDSDPHYIEFIKNDEIYWKHNITAAKHFITSENIEFLLKKYQFLNDIGLLSIDIDGNDYWIWKAINIAKPIIIIVEYNGRWGIDYPVTIPYDPSFKRSDSHFSNLYWGSSLKALYILAKKKGYEFVGTNKAGNNAYFVRSDRVKKYFVKDLAKGFTMPQYRESRDKHGNLSFLSRDSGLKLIKNLRLLDVEKQKIIRVSNII